VKTIRMIVVAAALMLAGPALGHGAVDIKTTLYRPSALGVSLRVVHEFGQATTHYRARLMGGGGAGEGAESWSGSRASAGSPGGSAAECTTDILPVPASRKIELIVGHGGVGETPGDHPGENAKDGGSSRIITDERRIWAAGGGSGGQQESADTPPYASANSNGRAGICSDPSGRIIGAGTRGGMAIILNISGAIMAFADGGASSARGRGFEGRRITATGKDRGIDAEGPGAGGGGGVSIDGGAVRGGHGGYGEVEIMEYVVAN
jgi:hypothetical protein